MSKPESSAHSELPAFDPLWNYGDPAGTERSFRHLLEKTSAHAPTDYQAELLSQIARCQGLQGDFEGAHRSLDQVDAMVGPAMVRARLRYLLERGRVWNSSGQAARALPLFQSAWELGREAGERRLALDALHMVAIAQPEVSERIRANLQGLELIHHWPEQEGWLPAFCNNLGEAYSADGQYLKALAAFRQLDDFNTRRDRPDIFTRKDMAQMLRKLGQCQQALEVIQPVADDLAAQGQSNGWIDEELAECLLQAGRAEDARPLFRRAYDALRTDAWVQQHDPAKLVRLRELAG